VIHHNRATTAMGGRQKVHSNYNNNSSINLRRTAINADGIRSVITREFVSNSPQKKQRHLKSAVGINRQNAYNRNTSQDDSYASSLRVGMFQPGIDSTSASKEN